MTRREVLALLLRRARAADMPLVVLDAAGRDADLLAGWRPWAEWRALIDSVLAEAGWGVLMAVPRGHLLGVMCARRGARPFAADDFLQLDLHRALTARGLPVVAAAAALATAGVRDGILCLDRGVAAALRQREYRRVHGRPRPPPLAAAADDDGLFLDRPVPPPPPSLRDLPRVALAKAVDACGRLRRPPGLMWTLGGPDGAGKSSVVDLLATALPRRLATTVRVFHTRPFLLPRLGRSPPPPPPGPASARAASRPASVARLALAWLDWWIGYWLMVRPRLGRGDIVLFDRYAHDYIAAPARRGIALPETWVAAVARLVPRADGGALLIADPALLVARKGETTLAEAARQVEVFRRLAAGEPRLDLFDTGALSAAAVAEAMAVRMMEVMADRARPARP